MRITVNSDKELVKEVRESLRKNNGYCPCRVVKSPETKCMCKDFIETLEEGECYCSLYIKSKD